MQKPDTTRRAINSVRRIVAAAIFAGASVASLSLLSAYAQAPSQDPLAPQNNQPAPPGQQQPGAVIKKDVNLVVLHTTVIDDRGRFVDGLRQENFRVLEDKSEQRLSVFKREDIPVSMGLVIDNSGSMRDKRPRVNEAALTLVQGSNPQDEAFVVNFNDDYYLDLDKDFTSSIPELKEALERIDSRGSTAFYDALIGSMDHAKKGHKDKKVLLGKLGNIHDVSGQIIAAVEKVIQEEAQVNRQKGER